MRHHVRHPVVVDSEHEIWRQFAVQAWPTLVVVDANGYIRETMPGEAEAGVLSSIVENLLREGRRTGTLAAGPLDVALEPDTGRTFLRYPGKILAAGGRLYISDSGHNRIVIARPEGEIEAIVGEGGVGAQDGPAAHASFHHPQGMALIDSTLYVADSGNHMIRSIDLTTREVRTAVGTGAMGRGLGGVRAEKPLDVALRSPWDLLSVSRQLLIAMAGSHQIWVFDPGQAVLGPWAGSGREDHIDGPLSQAAFAQPSGLARAGRYVIVADSEISSIRVIDVEEGVVRTIVGRGLFDFGDVDGAPGDVLLQHPMDVATDADAIYVADTYNNKIKAISFGGMETRTIFGSGDPKILYEPGGISVAAGKVYVADTNNHRILRGDLQSGECEEVTMR